MRRFAVMAGSTAAVAAILLLARPAPADVSHDSYVEIAQGRYLAAAGDCEACHTAPGGKPFAGGRAIDTPFGTIYSSNITPDLTTGIGGWSDAQFYRAMHEGIAADGHHLYPAFPYPWYTKLSRADVTAIRTYLRTLDPASNRTPDNRLTWPLGYRGLMVGWNGLFFRAGTFQPDLSKSEQWNRGAYLVQGAGHCGACHTQTNLFGATDKKDSLQGGNLQSWYAPSLTSDLKTGVGAWTEEQIVTFLKTGRNELSAAYGPMAEVVDFSTSQMSEADLRAIAVYLKNLPAETDKEKPKQPPESVAQAGQAIYVDSCSACHAGGGEGVVGAFPPLKGNAVVQAPDATTVIRLILEGGRTVPTDDAPTPHSMPAYGWKLDDEQIAAVASYIRSSWDNAAAPVDAGDVKKLRRELSASAE
jgi:mono/diheme cytochrome c family protein